MDDGPQPRGVVRCGVTVVDVDRGEVACVRDAGHGGWHVDGAGAVAWCWSPPDSGPFTPDRR